jgi:hypothetical protein
MAGGNLIAESIRMGASVDGVSIKVDRVYRVEGGDESVGQPRAWTFIAFEVPDAEAPSLADVLSNTLDPVGGWYCDFRTATETFVVFAGRIFRYRRGDRKGRAEAEEHARSVGVPDPQIDWRE